MRSTTTNLGYGSFGTVRKQYAEARKGFPQEVIDWLWSLIGSHNAHILDVGCGTGISARQIAQSGGLVIGSDVDEQMIAEARKNDDELSYVVASAEDLPFDDAAFDAVTAFSAFHWFANRQALVEIQRVLKRGGVFFIANKNDAGDFKRGYKNLLREIIGRDLPAAKEGYLPEELLQKNGFANVHAQEFPVVERFTIEQAVSYLQSVSLWNLVPDDQRASALDLIWSYCCERAHDGIVERSLNVKCAVGRVER